MPPVQILKYRTSSPSDKTALFKLKDAGFDQSQILGVVGKTEGNGCVNDFSRTLGSQVWDPLLSSQSISIFSGGTEGVLSPHLTLIVQSTHPTGVVAAVGRTRRLHPVEIGSEAHAKCVSEAVQDLMARESISAADVHLILIKCPLLTSEKIANIGNSGRSPITTDTYQSMALSRYACAVGIGLALGELDSSRVSVALSSRSFWTSKASCSSGAELEDNHILILANARGEDTARKSAPTGPLIRVNSSVLGSLIDYRSFKELLAKALEPPLPYRKATLVQVFAKAEADPSGLIENMYRHTMNTDSDIQSTRHARAALGGLLAGVSGDCSLYVSGGAEGQGPAGGGGVCVVVRYEL